jgi:hypothetical protein
VQRRAVEDVAFRVPAAGGAPEDVEPYVAGVALSELVAAYEQEHGLEPAGGYGALVPERRAVGDLGAYLRGEQGHRPRGAGRVVLLGCECGEAGCWPLEASVTRTADAVTWSEFRQPHRPERTYHGFGPFTFDRRQYEAAVASAITALADGAP